MAKGSFNGVISGKKGNTVFYRIKNSNNAEKQGWREYNAKVSNPQSDGQIDQRVKLQAVNNLYRTLKSVIQRGWENHKYGDDSRRAYLKKALGASFEGPYIEKGSTLAVPIKNVPIMYGSLSPVQVVCDNGEIWLMNVFVPSGAATSTVGDISQLFISSDLALEGDQVTIVLGYLTELGLVSYYTVSFYVIPTDDRTCSEAFGLGFATDEFEGGARLIIENIESSFSLDACCALCSISRNGDTTNLRSYAEFAMSEPFENYFYGNAAAKKAAAKASYRKRTGANTNWEQVPGGESGGGGSTVTAFTLSGTEIVPGSLTNVAAEPAEIVDANGQHYFVRAHTSAGGTRYLYGQGGGDFTSSATAPTGATNANTIDPCAANNIASGCRAWLLAKGVSADLLVTT